MPNKWSGCSVDDFKAHYQLFKSKDGKYCDDVICRETTQATGKVLVEAINTSWCMRELVLARVKINQESRFEVRV